MLTTTMNFPTRRAPSPQIRARDAPNDSASNGSAGVNRAPDVNAGANGSPDLGGHRCRDHEDRGDSTNYRKPAEQNSSLPWLRLLCRSKGANIIGLGSGARPVRAGTLHQRTPLTALAAPLSGGRREQLSLDRRCFSVATPLNKFFCQSHA